MKMSQKYFQKNETTRTVGVLKEKNKGVKKKKKKKKKCKTEKKFNTDDITK